MSRKLTSKCDGCGVEVVESDDLHSPLGVMGVMGVAGARRRQHSSEHWGSLRVATDHSPFPASFDLCEKCTARVVALLELEMPKPGTMQGGHAMLFPGGYIPREFPDHLAPNDLSRHLRSVGPDDSAFGAFCLQCTSMLVMRDGKPVCLKCTGQT